MGLLRSRRGNGNQRATLSGMKDDLVHETDEKVSPDEAKAPKATETKPSAWDSTKVAVFFVSLASLIVSSASMYQSYLNRLYTEDTNRPVLNMALGDALFLPGKGWLIENAKISNVGKMTALQVTESDIHAGASGGFEDACFVILARMETKGTAITILPGATKTFQYIIGVTPQCLEKFKSLDPLPTISISSKFNYTDRAGTQVEQDLSLAVIGSQVQRFWGATKQ